MDRDFKGLAFNNIYNSLFKGEIGLETSASYQRDLLGLRDVLLAKLRIGLENNIEGAISV